MNARWVVWLDGMVVRADGGWLVYGWWCGSCHWIWNAGGKCTLCTPSGEPLNSRSCLHDGADSGLVDLPRVVDHILGTAWIQKVLICTLASPKRRQIRPDKVEQHTDVIRPSGLNNLSDGG